ncbi:MAG TPA: xanthine dehydrogenase family protein molybdopterin-binding subunit [Gaiellales bacterium]|jgi:xanthine dehydrogenase YagR molybdenum-binding subunit
MAATAERALGRAVERVEAGEKVAGSARYATDYRPHGAVHAAPLQAGIARGTLLSVEADAAFELPGVLAVLWHRNAPALEISDGELAILQSDRIAYRGQIVGAVVAETIETARQAARLVRVRAEPEPHDAVLSAAHPRLYKPDKVNPSLETDTEEGDVDAALASAAVVVDAVYETPAFHNNPMEPHATTALWDGGELVLYDSNQGVQPVQTAVAKAFGLDPEHVRVIAPHVGGGFGSKGTPRPHVILAAMAARVVERPVTVAVTRQQMFAFVGYRTPTIQHMRLGADREGRLTALSHEVVEQTSTVVEFAEQTAVPTRMMYAAPARRTRHRLAALDVPTPSWMRAPGECPGMYALESAMDELAVACGIDPIELRLRNEPEIDPETGNPFSSRGLAECLRRGAERFGWSDRDPAPGARRDGAWLIGTGVAASTYPARRRPSEAAARAEGNGTYTIRVGAADIGTGARTVLTQIAADCLEVDAEHVRVEIGDTRLPAAPLAGGSMGTASWGSAVAKACAALRTRVAADYAGMVPEGGLEARAETSAEIEADAPLARHAFGAQFAEVRVNAVTGEVRAPRLLGVFAAGRILNPRTARSQLIGGMTMGLSMALHEESVMDGRFGDYVNHDFASYHIAACADVEEIEADWIDEDDPHLNPMGSKGIGEIGIVGTAAAVANAVYHAAGVRIRDLPIRPDKLLRR